MILKKENYNRIKDGLPKESGYFIWKTKIEGFDIIFPSKMRLRGAGLRNVLSPEFDYWTGFKLILPKEIEEWSELDDSFKISGKANQTPKDLKIIGVSLNKCPFCKNEPTIKYSWKDEYPNKNSTFEINCCSWINKKSFKTLKELINGWNEITN